SKSAIPRSLCPAAPPALSTGRLSAATHKPSPALSRPPPSSQSLVAYSPSNTRTLSLPRPAHPLQSCRAPHAPASRCRAVPRHSLSPAPFESPPPHPTASKFPSSIAPAPAPLFSPRLLRPAASSGQFTSSPFCLSLFPRQKKLQGPRACRGPC